MTQPIGDSAGKLRYLFVLLLLVQGAALASNKACSSGSGGSGCGAVDQTFANLTPLAVGDPFNFNDFTDTSALTLNGCASFTATSPCYAGAPSGTSLSLTSAAQSYQTGIGGVFEAGSAFYTTPLALDAGTSISTSFSFTIANCDAGGCADGMTFTIQNDPSGASALGQIGGQLGYGNTTSGIMNSVAIGFDTYEVPGLLVATNGNIDHPAAYCSSSNPVTSECPSGAVSFANGSTGGTYFAWVTYDPIAQSLSVYISTTDTQPGTPSLITNLDLYTTVGSQMYVGFTGGTGGEYADQDVNSWSFSDSEVAPEPGTLGFSILGLSAIAFRFRHRAKL